MGFIIKQKPMKKLLIVLAVSGFFAIAAPAFAGNGTISGTITHAVDGTPVSTIYVNAVNVDDPTGGSSGYAAADGTYSLSITPGTYEVYPSTGTSTEPNITFIKKSLTVTVASDETKSGQNIAITRRGRFTGHLYASDGITPVSSATVQPLNATGSINGSAYASSSTSGIYFATPIPSEYTASAAGTYIFYVNRAGYFGTSITDVSLPADETTVTKDIILTSASTVSGTIRDSAGSALADAMVVLTKSTSGSTYSALTNASGAYTVSISGQTDYNGTAVADYTLTVSKSGYVSTTASVSIEADASSLTGYNYALAAAGAISGTVTNSAGTGLSGVSLSANDGFGNTFTATTNSSGVYTISSLRPSSDYTITATKTNYVGQKIYNLAVTAGTTVSDKNFTLPAAKTFSGTIKANVGGAELEGAIIYLYKRNKTRSEIADFSFTAKSDGSFLFRNVSPGKYLIKVVKSGYITIVQDSFTINSDITGKVFKLDLGGSIYGKVFTGRSTGVASADISVFALNNGKEVAYSITSTDENGYYLVSGLKKGTYKLRITTTDYVLRIVTVKVKTGTKTTSNIKLTSGGSISGYLTDKETGLPVVSLVKVVGTAITTTSNSNGYYILDGITPGKRKVSVISPYYNTAGKKNIPVSAGKTKTGQNFALTSKQ